MAYIRKMHQHKYSEKKHKGGSLIPQQIQSRLNSVGSTSGNQPLAQHPFFERPGTSNVAPLSQNNIVYSKAPLNSTLSVGAGINGSVKSGLFNIDFNKSKSNRKKVFLNFK